MGRPLKYPPDADGNIGCGDCLKYMSVDNFYPTITPRGYSMQCKSCASIYAAKRYITNLAPRSWENHIFRNYGLTVDQFNQMGNDQEWMCAICGTFEEDLDKGRRLCVDHDHITGKNRGLLCHHCNAGLGNFKENIESLDAATAYLRRYKEGVIK